jgi:hypothetical protein
MDGEEVKVYRFQKGKILCLVASDNYDEAKMIAENVFNNDPEGIRIYKRTKARLIYMEDLDEVLSIDDLFKMLVQEVEQKKGGLTN